MCCKRVYCSLFNGDARLRRYLDAASYYFQHVERLGEEDYEPTEEDIVMARVRTTGISVTEFTEGGIDYSIVDVGGQRNERKKWIREFFFSFVLFLSFLYFFFVKIILCNAFSKNYTII